VHLSCDKVFGSVGSRFGEVLNVEVNSLDYEFARVQVLVSDIAPVMAPVTLVA
jgi:hypothetical protein